MKNGASAQIVRLFSMALAAALTVINLPYRLAVKVKSESFGKDSSVNSNCVHECDGGKPNRDGL